MNKSYNQHLDADGLKTSPAGQARRYMPNKEPIMRIAGVDLAWQSQKNASGVCIGKTSNDVVIVTEIYPAIYGVSKVLEVLLGTSSLYGIAIDAPLIMKNQSGQRHCEKRLSRTKGDVLK